MNTAMWIANILIPGGGLVLAGAVLEGLALGISFAVISGLAIVTSWIAPESYDSFTRVGLRICAASLFVTCQVRLVPALRCERQQAAHQRRRAMLRSAVRAADVENWPEACAALARAQQENPSDLLVAVRLAEALQAVGDPVAAAHAWRRVRALDRHHLYRDRIPTSGSG